MSFAKHSLRFILLLTLAGACGETDEIAPPAPYVDPVMTPTSLSTQEVTGSAEYGATVLIDGAGDTIEVKADEFTALFRATINLDTAGGEGTETTLSLTATDAAGNVSEATTVTISYEPPRPESLILELNRDVITADEGEVLATARVTNDELVDLSGFAVTFTVSGVPGLAAPDNQITAETNSGGVARVTFEGLTSTAEATVTAVSFDLEDSRDLAIVAGRPATFSVFEFEAGSAASDGSVEANEDVSYIYETLDAFGNVALGQVMVSINDPAAAVLDDGLSGDGLIVGLTRAGSYVVTARIAGAGTISTLALEVTIASGQRFIDLALSLPSMAVNDTVTALAIVRDQYANVIATPTPTFSIAAQNPATVDFVSQSGPDFVITKPGVYLITATFDDGVNPVANAVEWLLVEAIPDLQPPTVRVSSIDGFEVCPDGTLKGTAPDDCTDDIPAVVFNPRQFVSVVVEVDDDRSLSEMSYKAFGNGVSASDFVLIGQGEHSPGTPVTYTFIFRLPRNFSPGDATVVAQARDGSGNTANSVGALLRLDLDLSLEGGRTFETVLTSGLLSDPWGVVWNPLDNALYVANRDQAEPIVLKIDGTQLSTFAILPDEPEYLAFDNNGNLFVGLDNQDEVWMVDPAGDEVFYASFGNNEGLSLIPGGRSSTGRLIIPDAPNDEDCMSVDGRVYEWDDDGACAGAAGNCGTGFDVCVAFDGSLNDALDQLAASVDGDVSSSVSAGVGQDCENTGDSCVFFSSDVVGAGVTLSVVIENDSTGNMNATNVGNGEDSDLLYVADEGNDRVREYQSPNSAGAGSLNTFNLNFPPTALAADLVGAADQVGGGPARLRLVVSESNADDLWIYDSGPDSSTRIADGGDGLDRPEDVVVTATGCALVANRGSGEIIGVDLATGVAEVVASGFDELRGLALEGTGTDASLIVTDRGFELVGRISPTPAPDDCF